MGINMNDLYSDYFSISSIITTYNERIRFRSGGGIDRVTGRKFENQKDNFFKKINEKMESQTYKFSPYLEKLISKGRHKAPRMISAPTIRDKLVLSILNLFLQNEFPTCVKKELPNQRVRRIKEFYRNNDCKSASIVRIDIANFYDTIVHDILLDKLKCLPVEFVELIKMAITNPTVPFNSSRGDRKRYTASIGVPQGLPISNILAEIYLSGIDEKISQGCMIYDRYVDDIIAITNNPDEFLANSEARFSDIKLKFNKEKTETCSTSDVSTYLGYAFSIDKVSIKKHNYEKFLSSISKMFSGFIHELNTDARNQKHNTENIIANFVEDLNIKVSGARFDKKRYGWVYYYSEITDIEMLHKIDSFIAKKIKQINVKIPKVKSILRAYYHIKAKTDTSYSHDYTLFFEEQMIQVLSRRGLIQHGETLSPYEISFRYHKYVLNRISKLEEDLGKDY